MRLSFACLPLATGFACLVMATIVACSSPPGNAIRGGGSTPVTEPPQVRDVPDRGLQVNGHGTTRTDNLVPEYGSGLTVGVDVVTLTHDGNSSFIVTAVQGSQSENLTSAIGHYTGQRPLVVEGPLSFQVTADGAWSLTIRPMSTGGSPAFNGTGDAVSAYFTPPAPATWSLSHTGASTFFVYAHCLGGSIVVEDKTGAVTDTANIQFPRGPCFWEVRADGVWRIEPQ